LLRGCVRIEFIAGKEVDGASLVSHLYVLVIADKETRLTQLEDMLHAADGTSHLASCHILLPVSDRCLLDLLHNARFAETVTAVEYSRYIALVGAGRVLIISVAKYTFSQVTSNEELLEDPNVALDFGL
jgi:hypothetical protein